jgi:Tol biopolymer transport system component
VYVKSAPQPDVYVAKIERSALASEPIRLTLDDRQDIPFDWTPDSKAVFFSSDRSGTFNIYRQDIDQTVPERLVAGNKPLLGPRLNPEGTQLLYLAYPDLFDNASPVSLMRMSLAGGAPQRVLQRSLIVNQQCARARSNLCLYSYYWDDKLTFMSYDPLKGDGTQLYQITNDLPQLYNWSLSPDGSTLAIGKWTGGAEEPRIRLVSLTGRGEKWLTIQGLTALGVTGLGSFDWAADSKSLWITSVGEDQNALVNVDLQGRAHVAWRPKKMTVYWAIPSRDGRYLALHVGRTSANAWMLERP